LSAVGWATITSPYGHPGVGFHGGGAGPAPDNLANGFGFYTRQPTQHVRPGNRAYRKCVRRLAEPNRLPQRHTLVGIIDTLGRHKNSEARITPSYDPSTTRRHLTWLPCLRLHGTPQKTRKQSTPGNAAPHMVAPIYFGQYQWSARVLGLSPQG